MKGLSNTARLLSNAIPGTAISFRLALTKRIDKDASSPLPDRGIAITPRNCAKLIPDAILRSSKRLLRKEVQTASIVRGKRIELVDGSTTSIRPRELSRAKAQPKTQNKKDCQSSVRQIRWKERLMAEIINVFHNEITNPFTRIPAWRITRVEQSSDFQYCTVYWTIDDPKDHRLYFSAINDALKGCDSTIRYHLSQTFRLRVVPTIRFLFEDYLKTSDLDRDIPT